MIFPVKQVWWDSQRYSGVLISRKGIYPQCYEFGFSCLHVKGKKKKGNATRRRTLRGTDWDQKKKKEPCLDWIFAERMSKESSIGLGGCFLPLANTGIQLFVKASSEKFMQTSRMVRWPLPPGPHRDCPVPIFLPLLCLPDAYENRSKYKWLWETPLAHTHVPSLWCLLHFFSLTVSLLVHRNALSVRRCSILFTTSSWVLIYFLSFLSWGRGRGDAQTEARPSLRVLNTRPPTEPHTQAFSLDF